MPSAGVGWAGKSELWARAWAGGFYKSAEIIRGPAAAARHEAALVQSGRPTDWMERPCDLLISRLLLRAGHR